MILIALLVELSSFDCTQTLSNLYNVKSQIKEMKYCECMTAESLSDALDNANIVFKQTKQCPELQAQADSLKMEFTKLKKEIK